MGSGKPHKIRLRDSESIYYIEMEETTMKEREIRQEYLTGERALFQGSYLKICDSIFADGESPLKESHDIQLEGCMFK